MGKTLINQIDNGEQVPCCSVVYAVEVPFFPFFLSLSVGLSPHRYAKSVALKEVVHSNKLQNFRTSESSFILLKIKQFETLTFHFSKITLFTSFGSICNHQCRSPEGSSKCIFEMKFHSSSPSQQGRFQQGNPMTKKSLIFYELSVTIQIQIRPY